MFKNGPPWLLFHLFSVYFKHTIQFLQQINVKNVHEVKVWCWDLNSPPITIRPGHMPHFKVMLYWISVVDDDRYQGRSVGNVGDWFTLVDRRRLLSHFFGTIHQKRIYNLWQIQCDQIGRFIQLWATFQSLWQKLICPNPNFLGNFCVKIFNLSSEIIFGQLL